MSHVSTSQRTTNFVNAFLLRVNNTFKESFSNIYQYRIQALCQALGIQRWIHLCLEYVGTPGWSSHWASGNNNPVCLEQGSEVSPEWVCAHGNSLPFHRVLAGHGGVLLWGRRGMCEVASQGKQMKLDELVFDRWQRGGYYREQPKKDTETGEMCDWWKENKVVCL